MTGSPDEHGFEYVEHLNDIALILKMSLRTSTTLHGNCLESTRTGGRVFFWDEGAAGAARKAEEIATAVLECRASIASSV